MIKEAESGNIDAQYFLAQKFHHGEDGVEKDCTKAVFWYTKVMEADLGSDFGIVFSQMVCRGDTAFQLGEIFYWGEGDITRDYSTAVYWYTEAAQYVGQTEAFYKLGNCYYYGEGTSRNYEKAAENYMQAASDNHAKAQYRLGLCYKDGLGVPLDKTKAFDYFSNASVNEDPSVEAQFELAQCFYYGIGTEQNMERAKFWYRKAAEEQHLYAIEMLKEFKLS